MNSKNLLFGVVLVLGLVLLPACGKSKKSQLLSASATGAIEVGTDPNGGTLFEVDYCPTPPADIASWYHSQMPRLQEYQGMNVPLVSWYEEHLGHCTTCANGDYLRCSECKRNELDFQMFNPAAANARKSTGVYSDPFCVSINVRARVNGIPTVIELTGNRWARKVVRL